MPHASAAGHGIEHHHPGYRPAVFLLLRRIDPMRLDIDGEAVDLRFGGYIREFAEMVGVILLKHGDGTAGAGDINASEPRINWTTSAPFAIGRWAIA